MQINLQQEYAMTPETSVPWSGDLSDLAELLRALAAVADWASFCEKLQRELQRLLPSTRLDIYATSVDGIAQLRFTSEDTSAALPGSVIGEPNLRSWFGHQGYSAVVMLPLVAAGRQCGWLVLAQVQGRFLPLLRTVADQLAPLIAMRLQYELLHDDLINSAAYIAKLERRITATEALRLRALLATGIVHDIGNIFTMVMGHAQLLQQDMPANVQHDIGMIIRASEDGRYLLRRLQSPTPRFAASGEGSTILPVVIHEAIAADLREILTNLIMNAVAAMPNGGTITIGCHGIRAQAVVTVADTGHGIALEYQNDIFQPFVTTREHGNGLGLSVSRAIVEAYGGTLTVASAPGQGATFTITLPAYERDLAVSEY